MSVFLRLEDLFEQCLDNETLRKVLRRNDLSLIGDYEDKIHRLAQAVLSGDIKFRENFLHFISSEETREMAYQIGLDTDGPLWKVKEDIYYWFDQSFEELSGWEQRDQINLNNQDEILNWIKTGSLGQIQKVCFYIEKYLDEFGLLYEFSNFETKEIGIQRLAAISPRIVMQAVQAILESQQDYRQESEPIKDVDSAYEILGLSSRDNAMEIKKRYRELMKQWHPDAMGADEDYDHQCLKQVHVIQDAFQRIKSVRPDVR